jgi:hypothetical protein
LNFRPNKVLNTVSGQFGLQEKHQKLMTLSTLFTGKKMEGQFYPIVFDPAWTR